MPLTTAALQGRYKMLPNQRTVTLTPKNPDATAITGIGGVVRRPWSKSEVQTFGGVVGIESERATFIIPKDTLTTTIPKNGWWITDDESSVWTILSVTKELEGTMFRCPCILNV